MPTPNFFAFRLRKSPTLYYQVSQGEVQLTQPPTNPTLESTLDLRGPDGWRDEGIKYTRNQTTKGVLRSFSDSLTFVLDGAEIVRYVLLTEGTEGQLQLEVLVRNDTTWLYDKYFVGDVDLSTAVPRFRKGGFGVEVKLKEGGPTAVLLANQNIPFELELPAAAGDYVLLNGPNLRGRYSYVPIGDLDIPLNQGEVKATIIPSAFTVQEGDYEIGLGQGESIGLTEIIPGPGGSPNYLDDETFENEFWAAYIGMDLTFNLRARFSYTSSNDNVVADNLEIHIVRVNKDKRIIDNYRLWISDSIPIGATRVFDLTLIRPTFTLAAGDRLYLTIRAFLRSKGSLSFTPNAVDSFLYQFNLYALFKLPESLAPYKKYGQAFREVWAQASENAYGFVSNLLESPTVVTVDQTPADVVITSGNGLRQLGTVQKPVKFAITLGDLIQDTTNRLCAGLAPEGDNLRLEHLSYFFQDVELADLGEVTDFTYPWDTASLFNKLYTGMADQQYDGLNGKDEFNTTHIYKAPFMRTPNELDLRSPYRYDMYGIEFTRANLVKKDTTDNAADTEIFLIEIDRRTLTRSKTVIDNGQTYSIDVQAHPVKRKNNAGNTFGIMDPVGAYNLGLTPGRDLKRQLPILASATYKRNAGAITFQTSDKNQDLVSDLGSGQVIEKGNIQLPLQQQLLFKPILFQFTAVVPQDLHLKIAANPYGYLRFSAYGVELKGYINKAGQADAERLTFDFELIAHKDTDESKLPSGI